jgi:hypothetical protein
VEETLRKTHAIRDLVAGRLQPVDAQRLVDASPGADPPIRFLAMPGELDEACSERLPLAVELSMDQGRLVSLTQGDSPSWRPEGWITRGQGSSGSQVQNCSEGVAITTPKKRWVCALAYRPVVAAEAGLYLFEVTYTRKRGNIALYVVRGNQSVVCQSGGQSQPDPPGQRLRRRCVVTTHLDGGETIQLLLANDFPGKDDSSQVVVHRVRSYRLLPHDPSSTTGR